MRYVVLVFMFLLPLQFSAAVAAGYCQHEPSAGVSHPGHHSHDHSLAQGSEVQSEPAKSTKVIGLDLDCGTCHAGCAWAPITAIESMPKARQLVVYPHQLGVMKRPRGDRPDRPKWNAPARPGISQRA